MATPFNATFHRSQEEVERLVAQLSTTLRRYRYEFENYLLRLRVVEKLPAILNAPPRLLELTIQSVNLLINSMSRQLHIAQRLLEEHAHERRERRAALIEEHRARLHRQQIEESDDSYEDESDQFQSTFAIVALKKIKSLKI